MRQIELAQIQRYDGSSGGVAGGREALAEVAGMSPRNFARRLSRNGGHAGGIRPARPHRRARNLLEGSELALKTIAWRCGFGSAARMRLVFAQRFGITPNQYRDSSDRRRQRIRRENRMRYPVVSGRSASVGWRRTGC
jgi:transcriptional regulator GlxA family with amidase domain